MTDWLSSLSWLQICWLVYGVALLGYALLVWRIERHAKKVDGASGWMTFSWMLGALYGLLLLLAVTLIKFLWGWIAA